MYVINNGFTGPLIIWTFEKRAPGTEMSPEIVSGVVTVDAQVSYFRLSTQLGVLKGKYTSTPVSVYDFLERQDRKIDLFTDTAAILN